jgi:hypothetical protein
MELLFDLAILFAGTNSILLALLATVYGRTAVRTGAAYPVGLFVFSILLLLQSAGTAVGYLLNAPYLGDEAYPFMSIVGGFELVGLLALVRITV